MNSESADEQKIYLLIFLSEFRKYAYDTFIEYQYILLITPMHPIRAIEPNF